MRFPYCHHSAALLASFKNILWHKKKGAFFLRISKKNRTFAPEMDKQSKNTIAEISELPR